MPILLKTLKMDYALLIQRNQRTKVQYGLTHFHVRVDWPIADAAEDMAQSLRYISKDLYEKGDKYAEDIQKKFFEYYGFIFTSLVIVCLSLWGFFMWERSLF